MPSFWGVRDPSHQPYYETLMTEFRLKNVTSPGYKPPSTWEEVAELERPQRIVAARYFLRAAAIRLHQDADLHPDDIKMLFDAVPEWIDHQQHAHRHELAELRKTWVCLAEGCGYRGPRHEFFKEQDQLTLLNEAPMAVCPKCGQCDAMEVQHLPLAKMWGKSNVAKDCIHSYERDGLRCDRCGRLRPGTKSFQSDGSVGKEPCNCEGQKCPVCQGMGEDAVIENHRCRHCGTVFCERCHGIKEAQMARAYDDVKRCRCGGKDE